MVSKVGKAPVPKRQEFVQTQRTAHVEWGKLVLSNPTAAAVMHQLVAFMDRQNAVAISHTTLGELVGLHQTTIKKAIKYLRDHHWVQVIQLGQRGTVNAYVVNDQVAWADYRDNKRLAIFSARIIADAKDQDGLALAPAKLRKVPVIYPPEEALPVGDLRPGDQDSFPGFEPVLLGSPRGGKEGE
jgi:hypothetical protein